MVKGTPKNLNHSESKRKRNAPEEEESESDIGEDLNFHGEDEGGIRIGNIYIPPPPKPVCSTDIGTARLIIHKIVNMNFKSYAGRVELGPFNKCFTSIIGPNGSGKSNVIDSMLFVFGYRASKIRSKKISVLLHNSEKYPNVKSCSVSVHFKQIIDIDDLQYDDVPDSEFVISRSAFKDNSSYYELNGKRVHFKEIGKLLHHHGVDLTHNRFLILQGEVEQIAMMKPKADTELETGMLEYLEDIIGTTRFKKPLTKLNDYLEVLTEQRSEKIQHVRLVEKEREEMQGPYEDAINFLKIENFLTQLRNIQCQKYIYDMDLNLKEKNQQKDAITDNIKDVKEKIQKSIDTRKEKESELSSKMKKVGQLQNRLMETKEQYDKVNKDDVQIQKDMVQVNKVRKETMATLESEKKKLKDLEKVPDKNQADIDEIAGKLERLTVEKDKLEEEKIKALEQKARETKPLQAKREALESELLPLNQLVEENKAAFKLAESQLEVYLKTDKDEQARLSKLRDAHQENKTKLDEQGGLLKELKQTIPNVEQQLRNGEEELKSLQQKDAEISHKYNTMESKVRDSRNELRSYQSKDNVKNILMNKKNDGTVPGLFGRLGDLGAIDPKYDVAISTACGALDHFVVDTSDTAKKCIELLRGLKRRTNFIVLDKQDHLTQQASSRIDTPNGSLRLFDLVRFEDPRLRNAFYFALRDTLVTEDLTVASEVAYGARRFRVVTLGGELIELTGTMSGGGNSVRRGRMGTRVLVKSNLNASMDRKALQNAELEMDNLKEELTAVRNRIVQLKQTIFEKTNQIQEHKFQFTKTQNDFQSLQRQVDNLEKQLKRQEETVASSQLDQNQIKHFETTIASMKTEYDKAVANANKIKVQVDKVTAEIEEKSGGNYKQIQTKLNEKKNLIEKMKKESTKLQVGITTARRNVVKTTERIENLESDIQGSQATLLKLQDKRKHLEEKAESLIDEINKVTTELEETGQDDGGYKKEIAQLTQLELKLKADLVELEHELGTIKSAILDIKKQYDHWNTQLSQLTLHKIPRNEVELERFEANESAASSSRRSTESAASSSRPQLPKLSEEELKKTNFEELQANITLQQDKLKQKKPNLNIIQEYKIVQNNYIKKVVELEEVTQKRKETRDAVDKVKSSRENEFNTGFKIINIKLKEMYQMITMGGDAELELVDSLDPFNEGVSFSVRPPKKSWKNISNLSGGEKTLSSLALVFALHYYKPSPLYFMDEIDAALDFKNVSIVGNYIKDRTKNAQFIIISLRSNMFELADQLVGIYKAFNCTSGIAIQPKLFESLRLQAVNGGQIAEQAVEMERNDVLVLDK